MLAAFCKLRIHVPGHVMPAIEVSNLKTKVAKKLPEFVYLAVVVWSGEADNLICKTLGNPLYVNLHG